MAPRVCSALLRVHFSASRSRFPVVKAKRTLARPRLCGWRAGGRVIAGNVASGRMTWRNNALKGWLPGWLKTIRCRRRLGQLGQVGVGEDICTGHGKGWPVVQLISGAPLKSPPQSQKKKKTQQRWDEKTEVTPRNCHDVQSCRWGASFPAGVWPTRRSRGRTSGHVRRG